MSNKLKILLVEDEEDIASLISLHAKLEGFEIHVEQDGLKALMALEKESFDVIILDIMLPGLNGLEICKKIKGKPKWKNIPVIVISAKNEELDVVLGLELGADDYVTKPFSPKILFSRIRAHCRRTKNTEDDTFQLKFGPFTLNTEEFHLNKEGVSITLTLTEFSILKKLAAHPGKVLSRNQLLDDIPNSDSFIVDRNIDVHIASLRKKLGPNFEWIETIRGLGYRFKREC